MDRRLTRLYVSGLKSKSGGEELEEMFKEVGKVTRYEINEGKGFVEYETPAEASSAIKKIDGHKIKGDRVNVEYAMKNTNKFIKDKRETIRNDIEKGRCFKCKERGHIAKNCTKSRDRHSSRSSSRSRSKSKSRSRSDSRSRRREKGNKKENNHKNRDHSDSRSKSRSRSESEPRAKKDKKKSSKKDRKHKDKDKDKKKSKKDNHD